MDCMDEETAAEILRILIEDGNELSLSLPDNLDRKGKDREEELSDAQLALHLHMAELDQRSLFLRDQGMAGSIARASRTDGDIVSSLQPCSSDTLAVVDDDLITRFAASNFISSDDQDQDASETGVENAIPHKGDEQTRQCVVCQEDVSVLNTIRVPCGHSYCQDCFQSLFLISMTDTSLFPTRCCGMPISTEGFERFLTPEIVRQHEAKKIEHETVDRTYCSNPHCSKFIPIENIQGEKATCHTCWTITCTICKAGSHPGDCPADTGLQELLEVARTNRWQRCYSCRQVVEMQIGCNHITCTCGAEFCYVCGERWKTCHCPQWDENQLYAQAEQFGGIQPAPVGRNQLQLGLAQWEAAAQLFRARPRCDHDDWRRIDGPHQCQGCYHRLQEFILECRHCGLQICHRCRRNRLRR